jgi:hypothetical protein
LWGLVLVPFLVRQLARVSRLVLERLRLRLERLRLRVRRRCLRRSLRSRLRVCLLMVRLRRTSRADLSPSTRPKLKADSR